MRSNGWFGLTSLALGLAIVSSTAPGAMAQSRLIASAATETRSLEPKTRTQARQRAEKKRLSLIQQRNREALQQRRLLQDKDLRDQNGTSQRQLDRIRDQQAESLRLQQEQQRRVMVQQRRLQQPQQPGAVPRLTPDLDRPLIEQRNPSCGVQGMPLG